MTVVERVEPNRWRAAIEAALAGGERFAGAWASEQAWRALLTGPRTQRVLWCAAPDGRVDTIVDLAEAAAWDEREARDLFGLRHAGHAPERALVVHPEDPERWMTPVSGDGVHEVAVGPIHAGIIESGHFRFHVVGERILALDARLFYKHRGLERAAEGRTVHEGLAYAQRACAGCAAANTVAYAQAVEEALGLWPDRELRVARTLALELERLYNHLHDIGAICAGVGFAPGAMAFAALKDQVQEVCARLAGHRFLFGAIAVGGGAFAIGAPAAAEAREQLAAVRERATAGWRELEFAGSVQARLGGVGVLTREDAERLGASGPAARASGVARDAREDAERLWYAGLEPARPRVASGDVAARLQLRAAELETAFELLDDLLAGPLEAGACTPRGERSWLGVARVESPRGATACAVELSGTRLARLHLRTGSYANWPALAHAAVGNLLPDFPLINKSFELCYACVDR